MADSTLSELHELLDKASEDELRVLTYIARRFIDLGHKAYGKLDLSTDTRDHISERNEELADALVYVAFHALKQSDSHSADEPFEWDQVGNLITGNFRACTNCSCWTAWNTISRQDGSGSAADSDTAKRRAEEWITEERRRAG